MKQLTNISREALQQLESESPLIWLYEVQVPTSPLTRVRITNYTEQVTFGTSSAGTPLIYYPASIVHSDLSETLNADIPTMTVTVGDPQRQLATLMRDHSGLVGQPTRILLVNSTELSNPGSAIADEDAEVVESSVARTADATVAQFSLSAFNLYQFYMPNRRYTSKHCVVQKFGDAECGYDLSVGSFTTCNRSEAQCGERGDDEVANGLPRQHPARFKAFRGIPRRQ